MTDPLTFVYVSIASDDKRVWKMTERNAARLNEMWFVFSIVTKSVGECLVYLLLFVYF